MGEKDATVTFRIDREKKRQLDGDDTLNLSGLYRSMTDAYLASGDAVEVGLHRRLKDKENELERKQMEKARLESDIEAVRREIDQLEKKIEERRQQTPEEVIEFAERVKSGKFDRDRLDPENPAVQNWAQKAGVAPREFVREVEDRL